MRPNFKKTYLKVKQMLKKLKIESRLKRKTDEELLKEAKEETKENFTDWFERLNKLRRSDRFRNILECNHQLF